MKTYTLQSTGIYVYQSSNYRSGWTSSASSARALAGKIGGYYTYLGYYFDPDQLGTLRQKSISSITFRFRTKQYALRDEVVDISYAMSNDPNSCARSNADSTEASYTPIGDLFMLPHTTADNYTNLILTGTTLPKYGYLLGPHTYRSDDSYYVLFDDSVVGHTGFLPATLTVVTNEATITYDPNGGSDAPAEQTFTAGSAATLSAYAPTRTGYTFLGWALTDSAESAAYAAAGSYTFSADVTLYAVWQQNTYTVSYDANGGTGAPQAQTKTHGTDLVLSATEPTRSGYSFAGWGLSADATVPSYAPGRAYAADASATLYAVWTAVLATYTVSYDENGGSDAPQAQTKTHGTDLTLSSAVPNRLGHSFLGWALSAGATAALYQPGATYSTNANVTLYAVWQRLSYTVSYSANGGSGAPASQTKLYGTDLVLADDQPTRAGYTFSGWGTASDDTVPTYAPGGVYSANAGATLYAVWSSVPVDRTLYYDANGGSGAPASQTVAWDDDTQPVFTVSATVPVRDEHRFCGWAVSPDGSVSYQANDSVPARLNRTLYAVWMRIRSRRTLPVQFCGTRTARSEPVSQYDYGQALSFPDLLLPDTYEVHFGLSERAESVTVLGDASGVLIPDVLLTEGVPVLVWIVLHEGADDGETVYRITVPVQRRAKPSVSAPTPQEQSLITQSIAAMQAAVRKSETNVSHCPKIENGTWHVWNAETGNWTDTGISARGPQGDAGNGIVSIEKTGAVGVVDTYTVTFTNGDAATFTVTNGAVSAVNGKTGAVSLDAGDLPFFASTDYTNGSVGSALQNKADVDGYYSGLGAGTAEQLISNVYETENESYLFRTSGGSVDIGPREMDKLVGGTIAWNQLVGSATTSVTLASGRKYAARISDAWTVAASDGTAVSVSSGDLLFDLSLMFDTEIANYVYGLEQSTIGAGVAWFRSLFPKDSYAYNAGELLSVNASRHETVGFNAYDPTTGTAKLLGGKAYQITGTYTALSYADGNGASETITPDSDGVFTPTNSGTLTVTGGNATDTCVHLVWSGYRNGEYEPYRKRSYALDSSLTLRGIPKLSAGNKLYYDGDTYASDGTVTRRMKSVDLGSLNWQPDPNRQYVYYASISDKQGGKGWPDTYKNGLITTAYRYLNTSVSTSEDQYISDQPSYGGTMVFVRDTRYATAADLKTALSGKTLWYYLETPTTETAEPYTNPQIVDDFGTEEYVDYAYAQGTRDVAIPVGHETEYMANLRDKLQKIPALPATAGDYKLRVTVTNGVASYAWVSAS